VSRLYFVRHGESEANVLKVISNRGSRHGLTEKGRRQAAELASNLEGSRATRIYSSPLLRALQTAETVSSALGVDYDVTDALREFDCGIAEGRSDPESWDLHRQVMEDWVQHGEPDARIEQGESFGDIQNRFVPFIESLLEEQCEADVSILVGHGGLYLCMLPLILVNVSCAAVLPFPNAGYVLAEARSDGLVCLEWCGRAGVHVQ
jgi:broad specificity phosphatase PhoE